MSKRLVPILFLAGAAFGCGSDGTEPVGMGPPPDSSDSDAGAGDSAISTPSGSLLPWKEGNSWTYQVTGDGQQGTKVTTVGALEPVGGTGPNATKMANKVVTKKGATDQTVSWQAVEGDRVVRYRELSYGATSGEIALEEHWEPSKLHIDESAEHTKAGASWVEEYKETKIPTGMSADTKTTRDVWKVDGVDQTVTVPAGTFKAIVFVKSGGTSQKTYWYVPGVGKVKETGGQTEVLTSYTIVP